MSDKHEILIVNAFIFKISVTLSLLKRNRFKRILPENNIVTIKQHVFEIL